MPSLRTLALTVSVALLSATALALPAAPCHGHAHNGVTALGETHEQAAGLARNLVKNTGVGTLMTVMNADKKDGTLEGYPFGSMDYYVDDCETPGTPLMLLSHLQINVQNAKSLNRVSLAIRKLPVEGERGNPMIDPRLTLLGHLVPLDAAKRDRAAKCFVEKHPEAKWWLPGSGFHDFKWYHLEIKEIYYVGGFGGIHYIGWIDTETYYEAEASHHQEHEKEHSQLRFLTQ
ncbi:pyridoxamine 5'-phosphate oxidase-domain-containing protein [Gamsiella multidivaricata]|uniref:pyridoxamine 5'-phosphate oxidase-domain-containing protein n=1 Tax=Gamsiella multidivaricata TaxID=101098 RepID=UPI00221F9698|nr:pyridoxamine 5'-phosphate oxidase-domain-containing protein [Gamsiella multidivaricata]KAG0367773.1 hypothetical protein BGZ54_003266 [Gamsiella multidivaricata]KAI7829448.1 pyridoxamine 5'-phosphate oxidase-domain-containing protein [Gamsiella multidivaricata]